MILVIDNYDSFTYNLVQLIGSIGADVVVRRNDEISLADVSAMNPDGIVLSPGPGGPRDAGISIDVILALGPQVPILGICLGLQAIGVAYGGTVGRARRPVHGKTSPIAHGATGLFRGMPNPVSMTRYHSLILDPESVPAELQVTAWTGEAGWEDEIQGIAHREHPVWGVQFHPESAASDHGERLVANFLEWTR